MTSQAALAEPASEWIWASEVQQRFMQHSRPSIKGLEYSARYRPVVAVGGDFYDFLAIGDHHLAIAVGDASGKGLPGALMVSNVQSSVRTASLFAADDLPLTLKAVNHQVYESSLSDRYATLFYCVFDCNTRVLRYVNAGHQPPIVIRRDGSTVLLESGGAPVGLFPTWEYVEGTVQLEPGDLILACTDGVVEATNPEGDPWGAEGLEMASARCYSRSPEEIVNTIFDGLDEYTDGEQADDATVVALMVR